MTLTALLELRFSQESKESKESKDSIHRTLEEILEQTRAFSGCLGVEVLVNAADAGHLVLIERWDSTESDAAYRAWRATPEGATELGSLITAPPVLTKLHAL